MSDELNEVVNNEVIDDSGAQFDGGTDEIIENNDVTAPEAAPAEEKLSGYDKRIATLTARNKHQENELARLRAESAQRQTVTDDKEPEIPDMPDPELRYDDPEKYKQGVADYKKGVAENARWHARQEARSERETQTRSARETQQKSHVATVIDTFIENGLKSGISESRMDANERILAAAKTHADLVLDIYEDDAGPQIADFLAQNPDVLRELNAMSPLKAAKKIATEIKPRALAKKPHVTTAPDPATPTRGGSKPIANELDDLYKASGATFE